MRVLDEKPDYIKSAVEIIVVLSGVILWGTLLFALLFVVFTLVQT